jgi:very-short-patch-repair endonuclease
MHLEKKMRHLPFRKLMDQAPDVLAAMFPCFMCSPLSVSQLLPGERSLFDIVIFDEASQVLPEDAVPSLMRGSQAVVAGDQHQLPPTPFFADAGEDEESDTASRDVEAEATEGFESLLSMMSAFVPAPMLQWHYRSRDERLITFSNQHIYGGRLVTFPSPGGYPAVEHVLVKEDAEQSSSDGGREDSPSSEVLRVVELVLGHAERELAKPDPQQRRSLGVIALGTTHARRIEAAIDRALEDRADLDAFFDAAAPERFFVKNLERVQGDERDVVVLTLGIRPDRAGRPNLTRFGPLNNREHGYRRLNVAITRARYRMILVSSFAHYGIDASKDMSRGMDLLRNYLEYAAKGGRLPEGMRTGEALNEFEADVADTLAAHNITSVPQWGVSGYRIDLVAQHPRESGRYVLAIECDGASYHSAPTARDRDRLRQQHLEALGWRFHRVWSTDWFTRREQEVRRALAAYEAAVAQADTVAQQMSHEAHEVPEEKNDEVAMKSGVSNQPRH